MLAGAGAPLFGQQPDYPFLDPNLPLASRLDDLVGRMTLEEKASQLLYDAPAIDRLNIPAYNWWNEALHGVARAGRATVFPQAIGLAATWDRNLMFKIATVISDEARAKHHHSLRNGRTGIYEGLTFWSPNINIFRDPRWGRGMETYGEDPYLTGALAVQFVRGMQGDDPVYLKTVATPKHYAVHSGPEPIRHEFNALVSERDLRDTYLPAFRSAIVDGGAQSVMCAYNQFRGLPCCGSDELLVSILREEWGFRGYVVSDCWAIMDFYNMQFIVPTVAEAAAMAIRAGTDLNCGVAYDSLVVAVRQGLVSEGLIDLSLRRLMSARFRLGMFDPPDQVPFAQIPHDVNDAPEHQDLAREAARRSIVLLRNDGGLLPLSPDLKRIAVIGPNADDVEVLLGNYNGTPGRPETILTGIRNAVSPSTGLVYELGIRLTPHTPVLTTVPPSAFSHDADGRSLSGLRVSYFNVYHPDAKPVRTDLQANIDVDWGEEAPAPGVRPDSFRVQWEGYLTPPVSGRFHLGARVFGSFELTIADTVVARYSDRHVVMARTAEIDLVKGVRYPFCLAFTDRRPDALVECVWEVPDADAERRAIDAARGSDVAIMVMGLSPRLEGEEMPVATEGFSGGDRTDIRLPRQQEDLVRKVTETGTPVVLILLNGSAVALPYASEHVPAILEAWYPGQGAGSAVADVLFGTSNPGGRLPVTFYRSIDQLPPFEDYAMAGRTYRYFDGEPLYPFGYGLSYTSFRYSGLSVPESIDACDDLRVQVEVRNTGSRTGDEVVQVYVKDMKSSVPVPKHALAGFERVRVGPGESRIVTFSVPARAFSLIDEQGHRVIEEGAFTVTVGGEQPGMTGRLHASSTETVGATVFVRGSARLDP